jgi:hypothetical protein
VTGQRQDTETSLKIKDTGIRGSGTRGPVSSEFIARLNEVQAVQVKLDRL